LHIEITSFLSLFSKISSLLEDELNSSLLEEEPQLKLEGDIPCVEVKMEKKKTLEIVPSYIIMLIIFALILHLTLYIAYI